MSILVTMVATEFPRCAHTVPGMGTEFKGGTAQCVEVNDVIRQSPHHLPTHHPLQWETVWCVVLARGSCVVENTSQ